MVWNYAAVAIGGAIGCCARYGMTQVVQLFYSGKFPLPTLLVNVLGSFILGFLFYWTLERFPVNPTLRLAILTGGLGGFTTFSTFMVESFGLMENGMPTRAALYVVLSVVVGFIAAVAGAWLSRHLAV